MSIWTKITGLFASADPQPATDTARGTAYTKHPAQLPWDHIGQLQDLRSKIEEIDNLDNTNGQVKQLHRKMAKFATRGGVSFVMTDGSENQRMADIANEWIKRVKLDKRKVRREHGVRLLKHGNLVIQNVVSDQKRVESLIVMPTTMMKPLLDEKGQFRSVEKAYVQTDFSGMMEMVTFAKWQISWGDIDKESNEIYGRPVIDAERKRAYQIGMTDDDMVIRRRYRAPLRLLHKLLGMRNEEMEEYRRFNKESLENPNAINSDLFTNVEGGVTAIQGDTNLDQIADVQFANKKFYAGCGVSAHQFGLVEDDLNRDVYEDTLGDFYETIEDIQETLADTWEESLRLEFLLNGINADAYEWDLKLEGRKVETPNQQMDRGLKAKTMGLPLKFIITEILRWPWEPIKAMMEEERANLDPYAELLANATNDDSTPNIKIVEGNAPGGDSATSVGNG